MTDQKRQRLGRAQVWLSGVLVGLGVAAIATGFPLLVIFFPLGGLLLLIGTQNLEARR